MDLLNLTIEGWILVLRIALVVVIYLFLLIILLAARREWRSAPAPQPTQGVTPHLVVTNSGQNTIILPGQIYPLETLTTIGRGDDNAIILDDTFVSTHHSTLALRDDGWWIEDLGSRNGTYVNGKQIPRGQPVPLKYGNEIQIGNIVMKLEK